MAGIGAWVVEAAIRYTSNGVSTMERDAHAANMLKIREAELTGTLTQQEGQWLRLQAAANKAGAARMEAFSRFSGGVAAIGAVTLGFAIDQAANMERAMLNLRIATNSSTVQMEAFRRSVYDTAAATAQSAPQIAAIYGSIASTSGLPASSLTPEFLAKVTRFGEIVQMKSKGTAHEYSALEASTELIELAHQYRAYTPKQIGTFAEMLHKATYFMPGGLSQFLTQSKYYTPLMALSGGNTDAMQQSIELGVLMQQTGLGRGRGGTGVAAFERQIIQGLAMTKHAQSGRRDALIQMGLIDPKTNDTPFVRTNAENQSYFDVIGALAQVQKYADSQTRGLTGAARSHEEEIVLRNAFSALGVQGSLISLVAAGGGLQQMHSVQQRMATTPSIDQDQALRLKTFWGSVQRVGSGLESLAAALGAPGLDQITPGVSRFADAINKATKALQEHPTAAKGIFDIIGLATGVAALGASVKFGKPVIDVFAKGLMIVAAAARFASGVLFGVPLAAARFVTSIETVLGVLSRTGPLGWIISLLSLKGSSGDAPIMPDANAPPGSPARIAAGRIGADHSLADALANAGKFGWFGNSPQARTMLWRAGFKPGMFNGSDGFVPDGILNDSRHGATPDQNWNNVAGRKALQAVFHNIGLTSNAASGHIEKAANSAKRLSTHANDAASSLRDAAAAGRAFAAAVAELKSNSSAWANPLSALAGGSPFTSPNQPRPKTIGPRSK